MDSDPTAALPSAANRDVVDVEALRRFVAANLAADLDAARGAGHGFGHLPLGTLENDPSTPGWTRLDLADNLRPSWDLRFARRFSPDAIEDLVDVLLGVVEHAGPALLLELAQPYADRKWAVERGWVEAWRRPRRTSRQTAELVDSLREGVGRLRLFCPVCDEKLDVPDKGLGRASAAAWRTGHQHRPRDPRGEASGDR